MFLALVLASGSGMVLFSYMDIRERQMEFALLRTMGSARRQVNGVVWFNLLLVVAAGIGLGTWAGQLIGITLLPILEVSEGGVRVTPPMVFPDQLENPGLFPIWFWPACLPARCSGSPG